MSVEADIAAREAEFRGMCQRHDLTYEYSDDHRYWERGVASYTALCKFANTLPRATAVRIWNEVIDTKIVEGSRPQFYWSETE